MSKEREQIDAFLGGGPPQLLARALRISRTLDPRIGRAALVVAIVGWVPLLLLSILQDVIYGGQAASSFLSDFAIHARSLFVVPALVIAEVDSLPRLRDIPRHLLNAGFIPDPERPKVENALLSISKLLHNRGVDVVVILLAVAISVTIGLLVPSDELLGWHSNALLYRGASLARWWHSLVSAPLLLVLLVAWVWRIILWARFLWAVSQVNLRLVATHPDGAGGIMFLVTSIRAFWLHAFALGTLVAGTVANRVVHNGEPLTNFRMLLAALVATVLVMFVGPLIFFAPGLREARRVAMFKYGQLASEEGRIFEQKWMPQLGSLEHGVLEVPDFSATTDLFAVASNVYRMRDFPIDIRVVVSLLMVTLMPFIPVVLLAIPLDQLIRDIGNLLI